MTDTTNFPNEALTEVCEMLLDDYDLNELQIKNLADNIAQECEGIHESRAEQAFERQTAPDDSAYRRSMFEAGRGHLIGGK